VMGFSEIGSGKIFTQALWTAILLIVAS
jgi:hypothetical protein